MRTSTRTLIAFIGATLTAAFAASSQPAGAAFAGVDANFVDSAHLGGPTVAVLLTAAPAKQRCRIVMKNIRGQKRKVWVCPKPKPKPPTPPRAGTVVARVAAPDLGEVAFGEGALWVSGGTAANRSILRIDPATNAVVATIPVGQTHPLGFIAVGEGAVWVSGGLLNAVIRIDPATNRVAETIPIGLPGGPEGAERATDDLEVGFGSVWVSNHRSGSVSRIDPATNRVVATVTVGVEGTGGPRAIGVGAGSVWVGIPNERAVARIDPSTNTVVGRIAAGGACGYIAADATAAWVGSGGCRAVGLARVDAATNAVVAQLEFGGATASGLVRGVGGVAIAFDAVWAVVQWPGQLLKIDRQTSDVLATLQLESGPGTLAHGAIAVGAGALWIRQYDVVLRVAPSA